MLLDVMFNIGYIHRGYCQDEAEKIELELVSLVFNMWLIRWVGDLDIYIYI